MKKSVPVFIFLIFGGLLSAQPIVTGLPTIHAYTLIPAIPTGSSQVKIVTHVSTPNAAFVVDKQFTVTTNPLAIKLYLCYCEGIATVITDHIDTFALGQLATGVYSVKLSAYMSSAGQHCARIDSNFSSFSINVGSVGLKENASGNKFRLYPNPASDHVVIEPAGNITASVFSLQGQLIRRAEISSSGKFSLEGLSAGMYFVEVISPGRKETQRIVVQ